MEKYGQSEEEIDELIDEEFGSAEDSMNFEEPP